jgi:cytochrome c oxidase assembly protein subunit 15
MTDSLNLNKPVFVGTASSAATDSGFRITRRFMGIYALVLAVTTFLLMALGSATRVMDAGLACPDWPLCYGTVLPAEQMNLQVFLEWFHRVVASAVGLVTIGFAGLSWWRRDALPRWLPWSATVAVAIVLVQGMLGGLTVTQLLKFEVVTAHLATGLAFFAYLLVQGLILLGSPAAVSWQSQSVWAGAVATVCVYCQSILGGLVASQWAVHQCLDSLELCAVIYNHFWGIVPAVLATLWVVVLAWSKLRPFSFLLLAVLIAQLCVGYTTYRLQLSVPALTVMHQAIGAILLGSLVAWTTLNCRSSAPSY